MHGGPPIQPTTRRAVLAGGGAGLVAVTSGCAGITEPPNLDAVRVQLSGIRSPDLGLDRVTLPLELAFTNTGSSDVPGVRLDARIYINGADVGTARTSVGEIAAGDTVESVLAATVRFGDVSSSVVNALRSGRFALGLNGELVADGLLMDARQNFEAQFQIG